MLSLNPEEKRQRIGNLYEALQLYQASRFKGIIDNVRVLEEDTAILWVFHKGGYAAVRTNEGCCAADSNWLSYMLNGAYDDIGCLGYGQADGNGHITSYIRCGEWLYFIDMMMQRHDSIKPDAAETGNLDEYIQHLLAKLPSPPILFYKTKASECVCIGTRYGWEPNHALSGWNLVQQSHAFLFCEGMVDILYASNDSSHALTKTTAVAPNWALLAGFNFCTLL